MVTASTAVVNYPRESITSTDNGNGTCCRADGLFAAHRLKPEVVIVTRSCGIGSNRCDSVVGMIVLPVGQVLGDEDAARQSV